MPLIKFNFSLQKFILASTSPSVQLYTWTERSTRQKRALSIAFDWKSTEVELTVTHLRIVMTVNSIKEKLNNSSKR